MNRTDRWYGSSAYRNDEAVAVAKPEPRGPRPVFMVNPTLMVPMNDDFAKDLADVLRQASVAFNIPSHIYAFMRQLENDLANAQS